MWAIQSAMLTTLSLGNVYTTSGHYVTVIVLNFVVAIGLLFTPMLVKMLFSEGAHAAAQPMGVAAAMAMLKLPMRIKRVTSFADMKLGKLNQMRKSNLNNNPKPKPRR